MPLIKRAVSPVEASLNRLPPNVHHSELECVSNGTMANLIRQLSSLSRHAEDLFGELYHEAVKLEHKTNTLFGRMDRLAMKVTQLDSNVEEVALEDLHLRKAFKSSSLIDQQIVSRQTLSAAMGECLVRCDRPPDLDKLNVFREDDKPGLKFYTDPDYFYNLWRKEMLKDSEDSKKVRHAPKQNNVLDSQKKKKKVRQPGDHRQKMVDNAVKAGNLPPEYQTPEILRQQAAERYAQQQIGPGPQHQVPTGMVRPATLNSGALQPNGHYNVGSSGYDTGTESLNSNYSTNVANAAVSRQQQMSQQAFGAYLGRGMTNGGAQAQLNARMSAQPPPPSHPIMQRYSEQQFQNEQEQYGRLQQQQRLQFTDRSTRDSDRSTGHSQQQYGGLLFNAALDEAMIDGGSPSVEATSPSSMNSARSGVLSYASSRQSEATIHPVITSYNQQVNGGARFESRQRVAEDSVVQNFAARPVHQPPPVPPLSNRLDNGTFSVQSMAEQLGWVPSPDLPPPPPPLSQDQLAQMNLSMASSIISEKLPTPPANFASSPQQQKAEQLPQIQIQNYQQGGSKSKIPPPPPPPPQMANGAVRVTKEVSISLSMTRSDEPPTGLAGDRSSFAAANSATPHHHGNNGNHGNGAPTDQRSALLRAIQEGIKLKKVDRQVEKEREKAATRDEHTRDVAAILRKRMEDVMGTSDSEEEGAPSEFDEDEWDE